MERSRLSIRALVVLASELGAEHLFGVRDPFMMMDHEEIRAAYEVCLEELEQSGAITRQFEGAAIVRGDLRRLIEICAECRCGQLRTGGAVRRIVPAGELLGAADKGWRAGKPDRSCGRGNRRAGACKDDGVLQSAGST